ncbi:MAG: hypothetical protein ABIP95_10930 [Pelobium sp.]
MAKNIKAIKCPNCGSVKKTEIKPDYFVCKNCDTEYYLDNDDININIRHTPNPTFDKLPNVKKTVAIAMGAIVLFILLINFLIPSGVNKQSTFKAEKENYSHNSSNDFVFKNTVTNEAVLMRIATEGIRESNGNYDYVNTHIEFVDPVNKKIIRDQLLFDHTRRLDNLSYSFYVSMDQNIYLICSTPLIFKLDTKNNKFVDCTKTIFENHSELTIGVAKVEAYQSRPYWAILSNDGVNYEYFPAGDQIISAKDYKSSNELSRASTMQNKFLIKDNQLVKSISVDEWNRSETVPLNENKRLFEGKINLQNSNSLIISTKTNANDSSPTMLQSIAINTGETLWTLPGKQISYRNMCTCKQGFAVHYSSGESSDYISGVLIISPKGEILHDYVIGRNE